MTKVNQGFSTGAILSPKLRNKWQFQSISVVEEDRDSLPQLCFQLNQQSSRSYKLLSNTSCGGVNKHKSLRIYDGGLFLDDTYYSIPSYAMADVIILAGINVFQMSPFEMNIEYIKSGSKAEIFVRENDESEYTVHKLSCDDSYIERNGGYTDLKSLRHVDGKTMLLRHNKLYYSYRVDPFNY